MLPPGWEKRLHQTTNRYFYIDHNRGVTQWSPPEMPSTANLKGTYTTTLKEEPSVSSSRGLSRSHSSPDIKKQLEEEEEKSKKIAPRPSVNRGSKPVPRAQNQVVKQTAHSLRKRDLNPVYGNVGPALTGLRNLGNTCYMNSTIQCLNNASPLITYILNDDYISDVNRESSRGMYGEVVDDFAVVVKALWSQQYRSITPRDLKAVVAKYNPMFAGYQQQDSQEFLTFLLDGLHEGLNEGQLKSTLRCGTCSKTSVTFQAFMFLSLPIPSFSKCSLQDCIRAFLKPEMMTGSSRWKCPRCKVERDSEKRIEIWKLPPILLVGLNRFYSEGMWMQKKSSYVDFPVNGLDLSQYIAGSRPRNHYNLYGISNHYGTMEGGHYTAFCRNPVNKRWYKFDDQDVYEISTSDVKTSAAFVLYYTSIEMPAPRYVPRL
ncbi:ubiquitin carboxyl-terminal hydrolase 8 [Elysia marginata]|uniref:Ubiquitin carboxyl-terminal hydrolase n=1 Tax=Elysia marginata TaxID=1093978 RepID=A0AAV4HGE4_9GAST|nr:ubiquitin carboxyl-terminal hydrolase 8 [Elysia marginata]